MGKGKRTRSARSAKRVRTQRATPKETPRRPWGLGDDLDNDLGVVLPTIADYRPSPLGGWDVTVHPGGLDPATFHAADAHEALHEVLDGLEQMTDSTGVGFATMHTLDGDSEAFALLAAREGFVDCAQGQYTCGGVLLTEEPQSPTPPTAG